MSGLSNNMPQTPEQMLDELAALRDEILALNVEKEAIAKDIIPAYLREQVYIEQTKCDEKIKPREERARQLELLIKAACIAQSRTITGRMLQAVYSRGKDTWDTIGLLRYARDHRQVLDYFKVGKPYCLRIQKVQSQGENENAAREGSDPHSIADYFGNSPVQ